MSLTKALTIFTSGKLVEKDRSFPHKNFDETKDICEPDNGHSIINSVNVDLRLETERLKTYTNWPSSSVTPETLSKAGFYYSHYGDCVTCAFCNLQMGHWEPDDNPMVDHIKWSPRCQFVLEKCGVNPSTSRDNLESHDVCGSSEFFPNSAPESETFKMLKKIGVVSKMIPPQCERFTTYEGRLETFANWPKSMKVTPDQLARAGFFYTTTGDRTLCFHCGVGLKDWLETDDPWEQHARWSPKCYFLLLSKGQEYVDQVIEKFGDKEEEDEGHYSGSSTSETSSTTSETSSTTSEASSTTTETNLSTKEVTVESKQGEHKKEERKDEDSSGLCKICFKNPLQIVHIPCGHLSSCVECSFSLKDICPFCRQKCEATMRVYVP